MRTRSVRPPDESCTAGSSGPESGVNDRVSVALTSRGYGDARVTCTRGCVAGPDISGPPMSTGGFGGRTKVALKLPVALTPVESTTVIESVNVPGRAADPLKTPAGLSVMPAGSPVADHLYGGTPPIADKVAE